MEPSCFHFGADTETSVIRVPAQQLINLILDEIRRAIFVDRSVRTPRIVGILLPFPLQERVANGIPKLVFRFSRLLTKRETMVEFLDIGIGKITGSTDNVHHHLQCLALVRNQCASIGGELIACVEMTERLHARLNNLNSNATINLVETLDDSRLNGPPEGKLLLKLREFRLIFDEATILKPLAVNGMEIGATEVVPILRQVLDLFPLVGNNRSNSRAVSHGASFPL